jgi:hypothetical protein
MTVPWYCIRRRMVASQWLHCRVSEFLWVFIRHHIISYVLNSLVEILLILTYDHGSTDQTMNDSSFHEVWVVGLELQIITCMNRMIIIFWEMIIIIVTGLETSNLTCMNRFPAQFRGPFRTFLHDRDVQERKGIISLNFHSEFDVEMMKKLLKSCWSMTIPRVCRRRI